MQTKQEILTAALAARQEEVQAYQINIDNYTTAIALIDAMPDAERAEQAAFRKQLSDLLASEKREQGKAKIMMNAIQAQLG